MGYCNYSDRVTDLARNKMPPLKNDVNGNPRYFVHWLDFLPVNERQDVDDDTKKELFIKVCRSLGGVKYRGNKYGDGMVLQTYNKYDDATRILEEYETLINAQ